MTDASPVPNGPPAGVQSLNARRRRFALAANAVGPALKAAGHWLPLSVREAIARAVLAAADGEGAPASAPAEAAEEGCGATVDCEHPAGEHSVYGCADGCACEWMPKQAAQIRHVPRLAGPTAVDLLRSPVTSDGPSKTAGFDDSIEMPEAPVCTGEEGLCDVHGYDRHPPAPDGLRDETLIKYPSDADEAFSELTRLQALARSQREELLRLRAETATADQIRADVQRERDRLREELAASDETARRLLERHQELAAERYAWQERGLKAEATIARMKRTNRMVNGGARDARERAEKAEAANERVRALHDSLCRTDALTNPDDLITRGAAADRIATALDTSATPEDPS